MTNEELTDWLTTVVQGIVFHPEAIEVDKITDEMGCYYTVRVHKEDSGRIIGKGGQHAEALRVLLRCAGSKLDVRAALRIDLPRL